MSNTLNNHRLNIKTIRTLKPRVIKTRRNISKNNNKKVFLNGNVIVCNQWNLNIVDVRKSLLGRKQNPSFLEQ
jgi:hypothetical protein